ncbi:hypothetical protein V6N11_080210 [Hibiscus sabdariffa]|uniref:Uncharacterized protein n=1 Tax=Hibiscus sabdariffa TaxID=183260 RepID=A0ABR1ZN73_9ROSI
MLRTPLGLPCGLVPSEAALALCRRLLAHVTSLEAHVHGACSPLRLPCTPGALALSVAPTTGALDAALDAALALSVTSSFRGALDAALDAALAPLHLGSPQRFHCLLH